MTRSSKASGQVPGGKMVPTRTTHASHLRKINHLKDEVYREMLLLEVDRPGAEMGLALALLHAVVQGGSLPEQDEFRDWLKAVCPVGLSMIETALEQSCKCRMEPDQIK